MKFCKTLFYGFSLIAFSGNCLAKDDFPCKVSFSSTKNLQSDFVEMIEGEKNSIHLVSSSITNREIAKSLIESRKRGVQVELIIDKIGLSSKRILKELDEGGVTIFVYAPELKNSKDKKNNRRLSISNLHHKFCVFNGKNNESKVWTGSFNFAYNSSRPQQQDALIFSEKSVTSTYHMEYNRLKESSCLTFKEYQMSVSP